MVLNVRATREENRVTWVTSWDWGESVKKGAGIEAGLLEQSWDGDLGVI